ncbi:MAG: response regulator [Planctomycetes bacterium]|nr:response regulator [Planctomycetota bacterium]
MAKARILIVDDEPDILKILGNRLEHAGYDVAKASDGIEALEKVEGANPDLIVLDVMMPHLDGFGVCRKLRESVVTSLIPIIFLTAKGQTVDKISGIKSGADEYVTKPFDFDELEARIEELLRRKQQILSANPLTGLPGNISIAEEIQKRIKGNEKFAVCYLDINNFKSYNDRYGYQKGDSVLFQTSRLIMDAVRDSGVKNAFIGHIGGDDFIVIMLSGYEDSVCNGIIKSFDAFSLLQYDEADRNCGHIQGQDRQGKEVCFPLMSISIAVVTNERRPITHPGQVSEIAAELKKRAKSLHGSNYVKDARKE